MFYAKFDSRGKKLKNNRGQILVEYLLLLVIAVGAAGLLTKKLISRDKDSPGIIINQWDRILTVIGNDLPDCADQKKFNDKANCGP